ncbi:talin-1-like isoform X2 [Artemia franciscana]|uniref:talin-1-like isoform X2 n=1 Tax=Artemia franciscana TaxID=6661 RepID=UPI0032DAD9FD
MFLIPTVTESISVAEHELESKAAIPELGNDAASIKWKRTTMDTKKQSVTSQIAAMNAATASVVQLTGASSESVDHQAVGAAISTISSNLPEMAKGVKMIAALMEDEKEGDNLMDAARKLAGAFSDLLSAAEPENKEPRQNLLGAASKVGESSKQVLTAMGDEDAVDREIQDILLGLAKAVANTTAALVLQAKHVAASCPEQVDQNRIIGAATQCALATSQLVAVAKVVSSTIFNPSCQNHLIEAAREVARAVEGIVIECQQCAPNENQMRDLHAAAGDVTGSLNDLLNHIKDGTRDRVRENVQESAVDSIMTASDKLFASSGDPAEMVKQARILAQATAQLIQAIKGEADSATGDGHHNLLSAARALAEATSNLVETAKACASNPHDPTEQAKLRRAAEELKSVTLVAAGDAIRKKAIKKLENAAKLAASNATQCLAAAQNSGQYNSNMPMHDQLILECQSVADVIPKVVQGVKATIGDPESTASQLNLINVTEEFIQAGQPLVQVAKAAVPTVTDSASSMQLSSKTKAFAESLGELQTAAAKARDACGPLELESALDTIAMLSEELDEFQRAVDAFNLKPLPGDNAENAALQLSSATKSVGSSVAQLLTAASQGDAKYTGIAASGTASALRDLTQATRAVASTTNDREAQYRAIENAQSTVGLAYKVIEESRVLLSDPSNSQGQQRLHELSRQVTQSLTNCLNNLPGQKDVDDTIKAISELNKHLDDDNFPRCEKPYSEIQNELNAAASQLNEAVGQVVASARESSSTLAKSSKMYGQAYEDLVEAGLNIASQTGTREVRNQMITSIRTVSKTSITLLTTAKQYNADPTVPNSKSLLSNAARGVTEAINALIDSCTSAAPGQKECDNAVRAIQSMKSLLDNPSQPVTDLTYFECLENVMEKSKSLGEGMTGIANIAKKAEYEPFGEAVKGVSDSICGLVESAAQAAYLVGVSDPSSVAGKPGLVDQASLMRASQAIQNACNQLTNPSSSKQQVLSAATIIAKHTSSLCNTCRLASGKTSNPVAKRQFVRSATDVANATAQLVKEIKTLDQEYSSENKSICAEATQPLINAVQGLVNFASSSEYASVPAKISPKAREAQEPITSAAKGIIDGSCSMILSAKSLALNPKDPPNWQALANHSKCVSDSIKKLVSSIRDKAPGQKDCDNAVEKLNGCIRDIDQACLSVTSQNLAPRTDQSAKTFAEQTTNCAVEISDRIDDVRNSAKSEAERLGHSVNQMASYFQPLVNNCIGSASYLLNTKQQTVLLDQTKTVAECAIQLVLCAKDSGGNPKAVQLHGDVDESADQMKDALNDLTKTIENVATQAGVVSGLIDTITSAIAKAESADLPDASMSYVDYQTRMVSTVKEIARIAQEISTKNGENASSLGPLCSNLSRHYVQLAVDCRGACSSSSTPDVIPILRSAVQELGRASISAIKSASSVQALPNDTFAQKDLAESAKNVGDKVSQVLSALQAGSRGTQACINAASTVSGIIGDLDTTILFATAGTLHSENENESFADHRENILKTAKALVEDTKTLVAGAASSQEQLASAAQNAVSTILQLSEVVKDGASSLGSNNPEAQVMLLNAVKDVASALGDLIQATKSASGKSVNDPAMIYLKDSAKVMVTNVTSLLKTVKAVEDEHTRGTRALESTIEIIAQEIRAFDSSDVPKVKATAEDLVRYTKPITLATAKAVAAGNSGRQDDVIVAANVGRKAISDMLATCKAAAHCAESSELRQRTLEAGRQTAVQYRELLIMVLQILSRPGPNSDIKAQFPMISKEIALSVTNLVASAELLKANDWEDPEDPVVIAENELIGAAKSIDAAANKLSKLVPKERERVSKEVDETLSFHEMIIEAAKAIATATSALIKAASAAQRHLIDTGKVSRLTRYDSEEGQWSEGLVSAARLVAAATHSLVEAANALVQGNSTEEKLISAAKQVASSTAQLLVACKVKMELESPIAHNLQAAGNAVKRATDNLVRAAQQSIAHQEEESLVVSRRMVGSIKQELEAQAEVLRKQKEYEMALGKLTAVRKAKYGKSGNESDLEGCQSGNDSSRFETSYQSSANRSQLDTSELEQSVYGTQGFAYSTPVQVRVRHDSGGSEHSDRHTTSINGTITPKKTPPATPARNSATRLSTQTTRIALPRQFEPLQTPPHFITKHIEQNADSSIEEKIPSFKESIKMFSSPKNQDGSKQFYTSSTTVKTNFPGNMGGGELSQHGRMSSSHVEKVETTTTKRFESSYHITSSSSSSFQKETK